MSVTPPAPDDPFAAAATEPAGQRPRRERWPVPLLAVLTAAGLALGLATTEGPADAGGTAARARIGDGGPLVTPGNLRMAVERSSEVAASDRVVGMRVSRENVQVEWLVSEERTRADGRPATLTSVRRTYADRAGRVERIGSDTIDPDPGGTLGVADVPYDAPTAISQTLALATGLGPGTLDYVLLDPGEERWTAYLDPETDAIERLNPIVTSLDGNTVTPQGPGAGE